MASPPFETREQLFIRALERYKQLIPDQQELFDSCIAIIEKLPTDCESVNFRSDKINRYASPRSATAKNYPAYHYHGQLNSLAAEYYGKPGRTEFGWKWLSYLGEFLGVIAYMEIEQDKRERRQRFGLIQYRPPPMSAVEFKIVFHRADCSDDELKEASMAAKARATYERTPLPPPTIDHLRASLIILKDLFVDHEILINYCQGILETLPTTQAFYRALGHVGRRGIGLSFTYRGYNHPLRCSDELDHLAAEQADPIIVNQLLDLAAFFEVLAVVDPKLLITELARARGLFPVSPEDE